MYVTKMINKIEEIVKDSISKDLLSECKVEEIKTGYSIYLYSNVLMRILTTLKNSYRIEFFYNSDLNKSFPDTITYNKKETMVEDRNILIYQIDIKKDEKEVVDLVSQLTKTIHEQGEYIFNHHTPSFTFGCCGLYKECSDAKKCLQANIDRKYAKGCSYRNNLENGRIFYGKNKNI